MIPLPRRLETLTSTSVGDMVTGLGASFGTDVTGGMAAKVAQSLAMVERHPHLQILICSGLSENQLAQALVSKERLPGTVIQKG